jgi:hypothetical protein
MRRSLTKCLAVFTFLLVINFPLSAQIPYYDAIELRSRLNDANQWSGADSIVANILRKYLDTDETIESQFKNNNDFTEEFFPTTSPLASKGPLASALSGIGGLDVTNLADGFAKFLVKRTKEELNVTFFSRFYELIKKEEYRDARTLFPQTYATLSAIGNEIYNYQAYLSGLRESFEKDLNGLLDNLPRVINDGRYSEFFTAHPVLKATCLSAIHIGEGLLNKQHPGEIIAEYDVTLLNNVDVNVKAGVQTFQLFSESIRSRNTDHYWISADSLKVLFQDQETLQIYFGLIYQQSKKQKIAFAAKSFADVMTQNLLPASNKLHNYDKFIRGLVKHTSFVTESIRNLSGKERDKVTFTDYYDFYSNTLDLIEYGAEVAELPGIKEVIVISAKFRECLQVARAGGNIAFDINRKNYGSAIINTYTIYNFLFGGDDKEIQALIDAKGSDAATAIALKDDRKNKLAGRTELVKKFLLKYGSFISAIAEAETSDDVANAIEAAALPSGSSRIKRETPFNVALNAYVGLSGGAEYFPKLKKDQTAFAMGVAAPIGVAFSWGGKKSKTVRKNGNEVGGKSITLFVPLVDIGALASFRFADDSSNVSSTIQLKNIVAPGLYFYYGLGKCPVSIGIGGQIGPQLREVTARDVNINKNFYIRFGLNVVVDIPILNFYTKTP